MKKILGGMYHRDTEYAEKEKKRKKRGFDE
jgi:hypothetical protein